MMTINRDEKDAFVTFVRGDVVPFVTAKRRQSIFSQGEPVYMRQCPEKPKGRPWNELMISKKDVEECGINLSLCSI